MRARKVVALLVIVVMFTVGCGTVKGALVGAALGAAVGATRGPAGAAVGAAVGAAAGAVAGAAQDVAKKSLAFDQPQPLPWMSGKSVLVTGEQGYDYGLVITRPVIEDQLRLRGARPFDRPNPSYAAAGQSLQTPTDFIVRVSTIERSGAVVMDLRVWEPSGELKASSSVVVYYDAYSYGYSGDYRIEALRGAAKNAVWGLH